MFARRSEASPMTASAQGSQRAIDSLVVFAGQLPRRPPAWSCTTRSGGGRSNRCYTAAAFQSGQPGAKLVRQAQVERQHRALDTQANEVGRSEATETRLAGHWPSATVGPQATRADLRASISGTTERCSSQAHAHPTRRRPPEAHRGPTAMPGARRGQRAPSTNSSQLTPCGHRPDRTVRGRSPDERVRGGMTRSSGRQTFCASSHRWLRDDGTGEGARVASGVIDI